MKREIHYVTLPRIFDISVTLGKIQKQDEILICENIGGHWHRVYLLRPF